MADRCETCDGYGVIQPDLWGEIAACPDCALPVKPYAGSSGWSGTDTSRERADRDDSSGATTARQGQVLMQLAHAQSAGLTWKELADVMGWHHGQASGALSVLHKDGRISRLLERRDRCRVYVLGMWVEGRDTDAQGRAAKLCPNCGHHLG